MKEMRDVPVRAHFGRFQRKGPEQVHLCKWGDVEMTELSEVLRVNADVIDEILSEAGVSEHAYLAVKIANRLDPPNAAFDAVGSARYYASMDLLAPYTNEALLRAKLAKAAIAIGMERAAALCSDRASELAEMALNGLPEQARLREAMEATAAKCAIAIRNAAQSADLQNGRPDNG